VLARVCASLTTVVKEAFDVLRDKQLSSLAACDWWPCVLSLQKNKRVSMEMPPTHGGTQAIACTQHPEEEKERMTVRKEERVAQRPLRDSWGSSEATRDKTTGVCSVQLHPGRGLVDEVTLTK
jgi:hypothetical protein